MKKLLSKSKLMLILILILIVSISLISYCTTKNRLTISNINNIKKITFYEIPYDKKIKTTENMNEITRIINYVNDLDLHKTNLSPDGYSGISYNITVYSKDKTIKKYILFNGFFKIAGKWYLLPTNQEKELISIYDNMS